MTSETATAADSDLLETGRGNLFDATYYLTGCGLPYSRNDHWLGFFGGIADEIVRSLRPSRVFDAGCALGMLGESFWDCGVEAWGVDISPYAIANIRSDMRPYCQVKSITEPFGGKFDLVTCIEVLEHMPEQEARAAVEQMAAATDVVLFSSTPDDVVESTHINVNPIIYWLRLFEEYGFQPGLIYDAGFVAPHAILFRRGPPLGEGGLFSFSEKLRFQIALVRRKQRIGTLNERALETADRITTLETEAASARRRAAELASSESELRGRLQAVVESPAWRVIGRYRNWLRTARMRHPWVNRWFEPMAARMLRKLTRKGIREEAPQENLGLAPASDFAGAPLALEPAAAPTLQYEDWIQLHEPSPAELDLQRRMSAELAWRPKFSVIVPVYQVSLPVLTATVESLLIQTYDKWELCIVDADPAASANRDYLAAMAASDARIKVEFLEANLGIAGNSKRALLMSGGDFVALTTAKHGD